MCKGVSLFKLNKFGSALFSNNKLIVLLSEISIALCKHVLLKFLMF